MKNKPKTLSPTKLPPIQDIYNRIIWDQRLNKHAFIIGFTDRLSSTGLREKPVIEWNTGDIEIPWHRIQYILCDSVKVWDRQQRINLFSSNRLPAAAWTASLDDEKKEDDSLFLPAQVYAFTAQAWQPFVYAATNCAPESLRVVTYNVLSDEYEKELIQTHLRIPAIIAQLQQLAADIIILEEATVSLLHALMQEHWVQQMYLSEGPEGKNLEPQGILILARYPFTLSRYVYSPHKKFLVGHWLFHQQEFHVAALHLTSNRSVNALATRKKQLQAVLTYLENLPGTAVLAGDFNAREDDFFVSATAYGFDDIWPALHPHDPGYTFDPQHNYLAEKMSLAGQAGRLDRIFLRSARSIWQATTAEILARQPLPGTAGNLFLSDHFALLCTLRYQQASEILSSISDRLLKRLQTARPTYHSALVVIPPENVWSPIQHLRKQYDRNYLRWMPHITLLYGFVPEDLLEAAAQLIAPAVKELAAFTITLTEPGTFVQRRSTTGWIEPVANPERTLHDLQAALQLLFPTCNEQSSRVTGFRPHLTVGQFASEAEAQEKLAAWQPVTFPVSSVALISREDSQPFRVKYQVHLRTGLIEQGALNSPVVISPALEQVLTELHPTLSVSEEQTRAMLVDLVTTACSEVLGQKITLDVFGSSRLAIATPESDIDLVCLIPPAFPQRQFLDAVFHKLAPVSDRVRLVTDAYVPALKLLFGSIAVDLLAANHPSFPAPLSTITAEDGFAYTKESWQALAGCLEADAIMQVARNILPEHILRSYLRAVRAWVNARKVNGNTFGYLSNFSWTILAVWACRSFKAVACPVSVDELLVHFFTQVSKHPWPAPVGLKIADDTVRLYEKRDWMPILTSLTPHANSARNITRSTFHVLCEELNRATALGQTCLEHPAYFSQLYTPYELMPDAKNLICVTLSAQNVSDLEEGRGFLEGSLLSLVLKLEQQAGVLLRPYPEFVREGFMARLFIEILGDLDQKTAQRVEYILQAFTQQVAAWSDRPERCTLSLHLQKGA